MVGRAQYVPSACLLAIADPDIVITRDILLIKWHSRFGCSSSWESIRLSVSYTRYYYH